MVETFINPCMISNFTKETEGMNMINSEMDLLSLNKKKLMFKS